MSADRNRQSASTSRGQSAALHVDVGPEIKAAVREAAQRAGVRPSDWVRSCLARALLEQGTAGSVDEVPARDRHVDGQSTGSTRDLFAASRPHQLSLQADDVEQLDRVAEAAGCRSRPAAVRYALRVMSTQESLAGLRQLPRTMAALVDSNVALQSAARLAAAFDEAAPGWQRAGGAMDPAVLRQLPGHLEQAARVLAALRPLLAGEGGPSGRGRGRLHERSRS